MELDFIKPNKVLATLVGSLWLSPQSTLHSASSVSEKKHFYGLSHPLLVTHWPCLHPCSMYNRVPMIRKLFVPNSKSLTQLKKKYPWFQKRFTVELGDKKVFCHSKIVP